MLNRPDKRNALNDQLVADLKTTLKGGDNDPTVSCIVLRGAGEDFCSGADLSSLQKISQASVADNLADAQSLAELFLLMRQVRVPILAAVRGRALAGGCGLALACDIILAETSARFVDLPDCLAGLFVDGDQKRSFARAKIQNAKLAVDDR